MRPFLVLDNWHEPQPETRVDAALRASALPLAVFRTNAGEFPAGTDYCGAFVSASFDGAYDDYPWVHREHEVLRALADAGVPMLGLCFGAQILASALVGRDQVFKRADREVGYGSIRLAPQAAHDPLLAGLPREVSVFHWHFDEVRVGHPDIRVLADNERCANQLWRWKARAVWGIQPHPELTAEQARALFLRHRDRLARQGQPIDAMIAAPRDSGPELGVVFERFCALVAARA